MNSTETLKALDKALADSRAHYERTIADADRILEARRTEHYQLISASEKRLGDLQNQLEMFEALEHERYAAQTRRDLDVAVQQHKAVVEQANLILQGAMLAHARIFAAAGIAFEAGFNAATSRARS